MKIRMLVDKIKADFLTPTKARLEIELSRVPTNITYEQALSLFRNMVNQKHPPQMGAVQNRTRRQINQATTGGRHSRGRGGLGRGGRGARGNRVGGRGNCTRTDSRMITLTDGSQIKYHASFNFPRHIYLKMKQEDRETLKRERAAYNQTRSGGGSGSRSTRSEIQELRSQIQELQNAGSASGTVASNHPPTDTVSIRSQVSQLTTGQSIMGGRNEQTQQRNARRTAAVTTQRHLRSTTVQEKTWNDPPVNTVAENECDTNADTCCLGRNFVVLHATYRTADVYAYDASIQPIENVPIVTGATAYDDPDTGTTFILVFNESLYYGERLDHSLINPNQVRSYGIPFWDNPFDTSRTLSIEVDNTLHIPLRTFGTKIAFRTRVPSEAELRNCEHVHMMSASIWNPNDIVMIQATAQSASPWKRRVASINTFTKQHEYVDATCDDALLDSVDPSLVPVMTSLHKR